VLPQPELLAITVAAVVPPLLAAMLVVRMLRPTERSRLATTIAFMWGAAVAATVASPLNDLAGALVAAAAGGERSRWMLPVIAGPAIEELAKATGFLAVALVAPHVLAGVAGAVATGALIGLGFAATENVGYYVLAGVQGGPGGLVRAVYLRGLVETGNHAAFTATIGAGIGWARVRVRDAPARIATVVLGLGAAVVLHGLWNGVVSGRISTLLCNAPAPDAACAATPDAVDLFVGVPALEAAFLVPVLLALGWLVRRAADPRIRPSDAAPCDGRARDA
jgi:RsiW-degrading membrane proteinase PrsW (M82 family)